MTTQQYIDNLNKRFQTGISREHAYRGDLQLTLETLLKDVQVINDPARIASGVNRQHKVDSFLVGTFRLLPHSPTSNRNLQHLSNVNVIGP